ncbi:hypothetical protein CFIO01_02494 [Colletotrichum fioriniae PJ7]|uniref:Uncharacterized protein n=1 Tax=Colletotrichum fioriniae PJ7 TaxID=1445577 RepID=A0A010R7Q1_9PEZI|nr:hypothetical protein CFIO01_02494 [Colletotrichum fioriniae PJ7]
MMDRQPTPILSAPIRDSRPALNPYGSLQPNLSLQTECHTPVNLFPFSIQLTLSIVVNTLSTHGTQLNNQHTLISSTVHKHGWKPLTLSAAVLFSFAFASFILAIIIEVLAQQSKAKGGLALSESADDIPAFANFCYLFLPTIVAVIYSLLWSWIDLDVKRIQPWLEMSKPEGTTAERSIFLDYPYDFIAFVPLRAAKRRHWAVFYGGTVMVMIFWLITPLQSAILGTGPVNVRKEVTVSAPNVIRPASEQIAIVDQSILNQGYAITWLNQDLPPFTTSNYTLLPFSVESDLTRAASTNWTGSTTKYWTEFDCWPANFSARAPGYDFLDGRGCNATEIVPYIAPANADKPFKMQYYGYYASDWADYWLSQTCSKAASHQFLAIWARSVADPDTKKDSLDISSVFCEASYFKQQVNATVSSATLRPLEDTVVPTGPREKLLPTEFNSSSFELLMSAGVSPVEMTVRIEGQREYPFGHLLEQHAQVSHFGLRWPSSSLVGFAVGLQNVTTLDVFQDESVLGQAFSKSHKLMFSLTLRRVLTNATSEINTVGFVELNRHGIIVSRLFSAIVEVLLVVVGIFTMLLWWHGKRASSRLTMDPASLGSLISICQNSSTLLDKFAGKGCSTDEQLREIFQDKRFHLVCGCQSQRRETVIEVVDTREEFYTSQRISIPESDPTFSVGHYSPVKPLALRRDVGSGVILVMLGAIGALIYLKFEERRIGGLIRPTTNFEVLQILENYIPTIFATFLEPFWVLVNRLLCIIQPFKDLWTGRRSANSSIDARYTSLPPQLVLWRAARSGHFVLVAICLLALLSNLLAVGLGGLFNERPLYFNTTCGLQQTTKPSFNNDSVTGSDTNDIFISSAAYELPFYVAMNNLSQGTSLPPWTNKEYYFQPFMPIQDQEFKGDEITARTRGFGVQPSCFVADTLKSNGVAAVVNYTFTRNGEVIPDCPTAFYHGDVTLNRTFESKPKGPGAAEAVVGINSSGNTPCDVPLTLSWSRTPDITKRDGEMETWNVICEPIFTTSLFDVTVDRRGYILRANQASEPASTLENEPLTTNNTDFITTYLNAILAVVDPIRYHNGSLSRDWMNYLLKIQPGNEDILDPTKTPDPTALLPSIESTYRQLWALMLQLNPQFFNNFTEPSIITGACRSADTRIFMDTTALIISFSVLALNVAVAIVLYGFTIKHFLPRMPTTVGSILAYVAPSRAVREYDGPGSLKSATFSFGRYVDDDGRAHVGIELDPFVVPVKLSALRKGDTEPRTGLLRRVLGRRREGRGDTWL